VLEVGDTGVGSPPSLLEKIFDLFVQGVARWTEPTEDWALASRS
jgi:hypothetical protein